MNPKRTFEVKKLEKLRNKIIDGLNQELRKIYMKETYGVLPNDFYSLFEYFRVKGELKKISGSIPDEVEIAKELRKKSKKWNQELIEKVQSYEKRIMEANREFDIQDIFNEARKLGETDW